MMQELDATQRDLLRLAPDDAAPVQARPASILILVRDGLDGLEVFMMQRTRAADFVPGANVFPGGAVDDIDGQPSSYRYCGDIDDEAASRVLGIAEGGLAYWVGAIRECFEESGLLLATDENGEPVKLDDPAQRAAYVEWRRQLNAGE